MPRDLSGNATRLNPPGPSGYVFGTIIQENVVDGEIDDIYNEITQSISKNGVTQPTANLPMNNFTLTGLSEGNAAGKPVRFNALQKGVDIAVVASGNVTVPTEGSYFVLTGTGFNVTGFADTYNGRIFTLELPAGLVLVNSASLLLNGGFDRTTFLGDVITLVQKSTGVYRELDYKYQNGLPAFRSNRNGLASSGFLNTAVIIITWQAENYDPYSMMGSNDFTVPTNGRWHIDYQVACSSANVTVVAYIYVDGVLTITNSNATSSTNSTAHAVYEGVLNKNQVVNFRVQWGTAGTFAYSGDIDKTFVSCHKME